jgi:ATP-dependent Clp protease ATP-binding subunit ClpA
MFERFTDRARNVLVLAEQEARELHHRSIGTEHLLLALVREGEGVGARALAATGITLEAAREKVLGMVKPGPEEKVVGRPPFTPRAKKVLELSLREAVRLGHNYIGTEHLLLGLLGEGDGVGARVLTALGADLSTLRATVEELLKELQGERGRGGRAQPLRRRLWPRGTVATDLAPSGAETVEVSFGKFSQTIADPELAAALSKITPDQLHAGLRQAVLGTNGLSEESE